MTAAAQEAPAVLSVGFKVDRGMAHGEVHAYLIAMEAGQYLRLSVSERNVRLFAKMFNQAGTLLRTIPGQYAGQPRRKVFSYFAPVAGAYRMELAMDGPASGSPAGYELRVEGLMTPDERLQQTDAAARRRSPANPRLIALQKEVESGDATAVERFWNELQAKGTPLLEPVNDVGWVPATFVWRGTPNTRNVVIAWLFEPNPFLPRTASSVLVKPAWPRLEDIELVQLPGTDVWYRRELFRPDARLPYLFSVNDPVRVPTVAEGMVQRQATLHPDPLNPRRLDPDPTVVGNASVLELPGAPATWADRRPTVAAGRVDSTKLKSTILNAEREVAIYTPTGFRVGIRDAKLLVVMDGNSFQRGVLTPVILDNLRAAGRIPPIVAAFVTHQNRSEELYANPVFADHLAKELVPWVRREYGLSDSPKDVVIAGSSAGALASAYAAWRHPSVFGRVIAMSGSWWYVPPTPPKSVDVRQDWDVQDNWMAQLLSRSPRHDVHFFLSAGSYEGADLSRHLRDVLRAKGYDVTYQEFGGVHMPLSWRDAIAAGILAHFGVPAGK